MLRSPLTASRSIASMASPSGATFVFARKMRAFTATKPVPWPGGGGSAWRAAAPSSVSQRRWLSLRDARYRSLFVNVIMRRAARGCAAGAAGSGDAGGPSCVRTRVLSRSRSACCNVPMRMRRRAAENGGSRCCLYE